MTMFNRLPANLREVVSEGACDNKESILERVNRLKLLAQTPVWDFLSTDAASVKLRARQAVINFVDK